MGSQRVVRVRLAEFIRPKQTKIWPCEGRALHQLGVWGINGSVLEPHNSVCPGFFPDLLEGPSSAGQGCHVTVGWSLLEDHQWGEGASQGHRKVGVDCSCPRITHLSHWHPLSLPGFIYLEPRQLTSQQGVSFPGLGEQRVCGWGYCIPPGWCSKEGNAVLKKDSVCGVGGEVSTGTTAAVLSALSLESQTPVSPHTTLVHSTLPPSEPRVSACEWSFVRWPFNRVPVSLWQAESLLIFSAVCYVGTSSLCWCSGLGIPVWSWDLLLLRDL